jgi:hypothetical protein
VEQMMECLLAIQEEMKAMREAWLGEVEASQ